MKRNYKGVVWTDHAMDRLVERDIRQSDAWYAFRRPDRSRFGKINGAWIYHKDIDDRRVEVVAKKEENEWIIISVWADPIQNRKKRQSPSFFRRLIRFIGW